MAKKVSWTHNPKAGDFIIVYWGDHASEAGWPNSDTIESLLDSVYHLPGFFVRYRTVDFTVRKGEQVSKEVMLLASTQHTKNKTDVADLHAIWLGTIFDVRLAEAKGE